jgi:hypothetical protein
MFKEALFWEQKGELCFKPTSSSMNTKYFHEEIMFTKDLIKKKSISCLM